MTDEALLDLGDDDDLDVNDDELSVESARELSAAYERDAVAVGEQAAAAPLWLAAGRSHEQSRDLDRAAACYDRAVVLDATHLPGIIAARRLQTSLGNWVRVAELLAHEAELQKDKATLAAIHIERGRVLEEKLNKKDDARAAFLAARQCNPGAFLEERIYYQKLRERSELLAAYEILDGFASTITDPVFRADLHRELADLAGPKLGDVEIALQHHFAVIERDPTDTAAFAAVSRALRKKNQLGELAKLWSKRADLNPAPESAATARYRAARIYRDDLGDEPRALEELQKAVERAPSHPLALSELVRLYEAAQRWPELVTLLEREVSLTASAEERAHRLYRIGQIYEEKISDQGQAIAYFQQVVGLRPNFLPALQALGKIYSRTGKWAELAAMYEAEILATPEPALKVPKIFKLAEIACVHLEESERAIALYQRILDLEPGYVPATNALAKLYADDKRYDDLIALYLLEAANSVEEEHKIATLERVARICEEQLRDPERAIKAYQDILVIEPTHLRTIRALGSLYVRAERWSDLIEANEQEAGLIADQKQIIDLLHKNGEIYEDRIGDKEKAIGAYKQVLALAPNYLPALRSLGRLYLQKGRWQDLAAMYRQEIEVTSVPEQAAALHYKVGDVLLEKLVDEDGAVVAFERVLEIVPSHRQALGALAQIFRNRGDWHKLVAVIEREAVATADDRQRAARWFEAGELCEHRLGEPQKAVTCYQKALEATADFAPAEDALVAGWSELGEFRAVAAHLQHRLEETTVNAQRLSLCKRLGDVTMRELGDLPTAMRAYEDALDVDPADVGSMLRLEHIYEERREYKKLVPLLEELASLSRDPKVAVSYQLQAAAVKEDNLDPPEPSEDNYRAALALDPGNALALRALDALLHRKHDAVGLGALYAQLATGGDDKDLLVERAEMVLEAGSDPAPLLPALETLVRDEPKNLLALRVLRRVYDKVGNWAGFLSTSEAEGRLTMDPVRAAKLLTDVGLVQWRKGDDLAAAKATLQAALDRDPGAKPAFSALSELLSVSEEWAELATLLAHRKGARGEYSVEAGAIYFAKLNDRERARVCFEESLERDPDRVEAHMALGELCSSSDDPILAVDHYARALKGHASSEQTALVHAKLAELYCSRLNDPARGQQHLRAAMVANPLDLMTLETTRAVIRSLGDVAAETAVLTRMIELIEIPEDKAARCVMLGELLLSTGDDEGAAAAFDRAVKAWPQVALPADRMLGVHERAGNWAKLLEGLREALKQPAQNHAKARLHARIAGIYAEQLKDFALAATEMKHAVQLEPADVALHERLALYLSANPATLNEAIVAFRSLLVKDPFRPQTLRALCHIYAQQRADDKAFCFAEALVFMRVADQAEQTFYLQGKERLANTVDNALGADDVRDVLDVDEHGAIGEIFAVLAAELSEMYPPEHPADGFDKADRLGPKSTDPLRVAADAIGRALDAPEMTVLVADAEASVCTSDTGSPPALIVARDLVRRVPPLEQRFSLGRALLALRQGHHLLRRLPPAELSLFIESVVLAVNPDYEPVERSADRATEKAKTLRSALSRKSKKALEAPAKAFAADNRTFDARAFLIAAEKSELRAATLMAASLEVATRCLAKLQGATLPHAFTDVTEATLVLARLPGFLPIFHFYLSEQHFSLRHKLRIAIDA